MGIEDEINKLDLDMKWIKELPLMQDIVSQMLDLDDEICNSGDESSVKEVIQVMLENLPLSLSGSYMRIPSQVLPYLLLAGFRIGRRYEKIRRK